MVNEERRNIKFQDRHWVTSVTDFIEDLQKVREDNNNRKLWFRGQSKTEYRLVPTIGRKQKYSEREAILSKDQERELLHRFRRRAYSHVSKALNAGETMFLARHHGLPTRLLDWTANALYGLYFSCAEHPKHPSALWAILRFPVGEVEVLDAFDLAMKQKEDEILNLYPCGDRGITRDKKTEDAVKLVHPFYNSPRMVAQDGAFTFHSNPWKPLDSYKDALFQYKNLDIYALYRWRIRSRHKHRILEQLSGLGITHRMVFPDLDGIAKSLWETEVLWLGNKRKF